MPLTDDDFNVAPAMFPAKKNKDQRPYATKVAKSPLSQLSVARDNPVVASANISPAKMGQASTHLSNLQKNKNLVTQVSKDLQQDSGYTDEEPKETTEVAIYQAMDEIAPYENTIQWYPANNLPGVSDDMIRAMGKAIFQQYTKAPLDSIYAVATLTNPEKNVAVMYKGLKEKGSFVADVLYDFEQVMPDYAAEAKVYRYKGIEFLLVKDFMGYYIYAWDKATSLLGDGDAAKKQLEHQDSMFRSRLRKIADRY